MNEYPITITKTLRENDLCDLFVGVLEGGSSFWMADYDFYVTRVKDPDEIVGWRYTAVTFHRKTPDDLDLETPKNLEITPALLAEAIGKILSGGVAASYVSQQIVDCIDEIGAVDADAADAIFQVAVFGEIVYG